MSNYQALKVSMEHQIAHIQLCRPEKANALNRALWMEIQTAFEWADDEPTVRVIVLSAEGQHFSAGIDFELLSEVLEEVSHLPEGRKQERLRHIILQFQDSFTTLERCRKPILAAVHGVCLGGGLDLISACDMRYSTQDARFSLKEIDLGIVADVGSLQRLPKLIGTGILRELAFTGREFDGIEARAMGLVNSIYPDKSSLLAVVMERAQQIATKSPLTIRGIKAMLNYARDHSLADSLEFVATHNATMLLSTDTQEAILATIQKRPAKFLD